MKYLLALVCLLSLACVTASDLERVELKIDEAAEDGIVTDAEYNAVRDEIRSVSDEVRQRTQDSLSGLAEQGGVAGIVTSLGLGLWAAHRKRARKVEHHEIKEAVKAEVKP